MRTHHLLPAALVLAVGCAPPAPVATPASVFTAVASVTPAPPTPTAPATPAASPTPDVPAPSATPATVRNPLTGLPLEDPTVLERPPLAIKIAHFPRTVRTWQSGLSLADNVWEVYAEGGVTRFNAIFWSQTPERVGNVRSARLLDVILMDAYQALLVTSGSSTGTLNRLREDPERFRRVVAEATNYDYCPVLCREESAAVSTNRLFAEPAAIWEVAAERDLAAPPSFDGYRFSDMPANPGLPITTVHLDFQINNTVTEWRYDASAGLYDRWIDTDVQGELSPHRDTLTGDALRAATVVMVYVPHVPSNIVVEEGGGTQFSYDVQFTGRGPARVFRDGVMIEGEWRRAEGKGELPRFVDMRGDPIAFKPGQIWFAVYSADSPTNIDADNAYFQARFRAPALVLPTP